MNTSNIKTGKSRKKNNLSLHSSMQSSTDFRLKKKMGLRISKKDLESYWRSTSKFSQVKRLPELPLPATQIFISFDDIEIIPEKLQSLLQIKLNGNIYKEGDKFFIFYYGENCQVKIDKIFSELSSSNNRSTIFMVEGEKTIFELFKTKSGEERDDNLQDLNYISRTDVFGGYEEILDEIQSIARLSLDVNVKSVFNKLKAVIIYGSIGSGKTSLVNKIANESQAFKIFIKGCELISKFYGKSEIKIIELLTQAKKMSPSIIIIDDIDLLCPKSTNDTTEQYKKILSNLSSFLDSLDDITPIFVLASTSNIDEVHPNLRQSRRFEKEFELEIPNPDTRYKILKAILKFYPSVSDDDLKEISRMTHGFVAADLKLLCTKAIINANENFSDIDINELKRTLEFVTPSAMHENVIQVPNVRFTDIGGQQELKNTLEKTLIWPLKYPDDISRLGLIPSKGILMFGPPGCSKTMIAKALATENKLNFLSIKCSELFSKWLGDSERAIRDLFQRAKQVAPSIVFLDELDVFAGQRSSSNEEGCDVEGRVATQLLTEIDGFESINNVIIIGATNRPDLIDPALLRPGRLDKIVYVSLPDENTRKEIFTIIFKKMPVTPEVVANLDKLVNLTEGFSGAEVNSLCQHAGTEALEENNDISNIDLKYFYQALKSVTARTPKYLMDIYSHFLKEENCI